MSTPEPALARALEQTNCPGDGVFSLSRNPRVVRRPRRGAAGALAASVLLGLCGAASAAGVPDVVGKTATTLNEMFWKGGVMMWPILLCSVVMVALFFERLVGLRRGAIIPRKLRRRAVGLVTEGKVDEALDVCEASRSPFARLLHACLIRADASGFEMEAALEEAGSRVLYDMRRNSKALGVIADISPLLGLMGTVTGMIKAFNVVAKSGGLGRAELLAEGISEALLTTAFGLLVAIPATLLYHYFRGRAEDLLREMEDTCIESVIELRKVRSRP